MTIAQNINVLYKRLTPLLAVQTFSDGARAERGVLARGLVPAVGVYRGSWCTCSGGLSWQLVSLQWVFVPAAGGIPACDVPVAGAMPVAGVWNC